MIDSLAATDSIVRFSHTDCSAHSITALTQLASGVEPLPLPLDKVLPCGLTAMWTGRPTWSKPVRWATRVIP